MYSFIETFGEFNNGNARFVFAYPLSFTPRKAENTETYARHLWFHPKVGK
jgi:hypothetical protein